MVGFVFIFGVVIRNSPFRLFKVAGELIMHLLENGFLFDFIGVGIKGPIRNREGFLELMFGGGNDERFRITILSLLLKRV